MKYDNGVWGAKSRSRVNDEKIECNRPESEGQVTKDTIRRRYRKSIEWREVSNEILAKVDQVDVPDWNIETEMETDRGRLKSCLIEEIKRKNKFFVR